MNGYDGNDVNADIIDTDGGGVPTVPDTSFFGDLLAGAEEAQQLAEDCGESQAQEGAEMSRLSKEIETIGDSLGSPPKCCSGRVSSWNRKIRKMTTLCQEFNANATILSQRCQASDQQMDCSNYSSMKIKKCSKWKCWLTIILSVIMIVVGAILCITGVGAAIGAALIVGGVAMLVGSMVGGVLGSILSVVGLVVAGFVGGPIAMLAVGAAMAINMLGGPEDGSSAQNEDGAEG